MKNSNKEPLNISIQTDDVIRNVDNNFDEGTNYLLIKINEIKIVIDSTNFCRRWGNDLWLNGEISLKGMLKIEDSIFISYSIDNKIHFKTSKDLIQWYSPSNEELIMLKSKPEEFWSWNNENEILNSIVEKKFAPLISLLKVDDIKQIDIKQIEQQLTQLNERQLELFFIVLNNEVNTNIENCEAIFKQYENIVTKSVNEPLPDDDAEIFKKEYAKESSQYTEPQKRMAEWLLQPNIATNVNNNNLSPPDKIIIKNKLLWLFYLFFMCLFKIVFILYFFFTFLRYWIKRFIDYIKHKMGH